MFSRVAEDIGYSQHNDVRVYKSFSRPAVFCHEYGSYLEQDHCFLLRAGYNLDLSCRNFLSPETSSSVPPVCLCLRS